MHRINRRHIHMWFDQIESCRSAKHFPCSFECQTILCACVCVCASLRSRNLFIHECAFHPASGHAIHCRCVRHCVLGEWLKPFTNHQKNPNRNERRRHFNALHTSFSSVSSENLHMRWTMCSRVCVQFEYETLSTMYFPIIFRMDMAFCVDFVTFCCFLLVSHTRTQQRGPHRHV